MSKALKKNRCSQLIALDTGTTPVLLLQFMTRKGGRERNTT